MEKTSQNNETPPVKVGGTQSKVVETYVEDMAKVIESDKTGLIKKIIHEDEGYEIGNGDVSPATKKNVIFVFFSILLIILGLGTLVYFINKQKVPVVPVVTQFTPLIFTDTSASLDVGGFTKDAIVQTIYNTVHNVNIKTGGVEGIYLLNNKVNVGLREFTSLIKGNFVPDVAGDVTQYVDDNFLMGVVNNDTKDFFMLLKMRSAADIFDPLRAWENKMFSDLHGFFGITLNSDTNYLLSANFTDTIIENKNARILSDKNGNIVMMYIFADDNSVVITNTVAAAHEIMQRLAASRVGK